MKGWAIYWLERLAFQWRYGLPKRGDVVVSRDGHGRPTLWKRP
jgi:hypothetical protein